MQALRRQLAEHLPLRQLPLPQSELELQLPSGAFAHLPERHDAPPQSELLLHELPALLLLQCSYLHSSFAPVC